MAQAAFTEVVKEVFDRHPIIVAYRWTQGTPSFNDGDPCTFSSHHEYGDVQYADAKPDEYEDDLFTEEGYVENSDPQKAEKEAAREAMIEAISLFDEDDLEDLFGNGAMVTVTRDGVDTDYWDPGY